MRTFHFSLLGIVLLAGGFRALADGPHWQVPNPEYEPKKEDEKDKKKKRVKDPPFDPFAKLIPKEYGSNPGDFFKLDDACIKYYEQNCAISYEDRPFMLIPRAVDRGPAEKKQAKTKEELRRAFYLLVMQRCAQAMREVDQYLPCPDSYPLWHEEVLREDMIKYATRTWVLASKLPPADAEACLEFCVKAYTDTIRFAGDVRNPGAPRWLAERAKRDKEFSTLLEQMAAEKDPKKSAALQLKWCQLATAHSAGAQLAKEYTTFRLTTGDIPICVSDAEVRMARALVEVGPSVIPFLLRDPGRNNPNVQRAVRALIETMKSRWNLNNDLISMNPTAQNVADVLGQIAAKPLDMGAQSRRRALESMGPKAWDHLVRLAESGSPEVQKEALSMLRAFTKKPAPATLEDIKTVVAELLAAEKAKEQPPPKPLDLDPTTTKKDGEKRPDAPPDEPETE